MRGYLLQFFGGAISSHGEERGHAFLLRHVGGARLAVGAHTHEARREDVFYHHHLVGQFGIFLRETLCRLLRDGDDAVVALPHRQLQGLGHGDVAVVGMEPPYLPFRLDLRGQDVGWRDEGECEVVFAKAVETRQLRHDILADEAVSGVAVLGPLASHILSEAVLRPEPRQHHPHITLAEGFLHRPFHHGVGADGGQHVHPTGDELHHLAARVVEEEVHIHLLGVECHEQSDETGLRTAYLKVVDVDEYTGFGHALFLGCHSLSNHFHKGTISI